MAGINPCGKAGCEVDAIECDCLKARQFEDDAVHPWCGQVAQTVIAFSIGDGRHIRHLQSRTRGRHRHTWQYAAGLVSGLSR